MSNMFKPGAWTVTSMLLAAILITPLLATGLVGPLAVAVAVATAYILGIIKGVDD